MQNKGYGGAFWDGATVISFTYAAIIIIADILGYYPKTIPSEKKVQSGYATPSKLEIVVRDKGERKLGKTILSYDNLEYHLRFDGNDIYLVPYKNQE